MVLFKSFLGKSLFVTLFTLFFIGAYLVRSAAINTPVDGGFLITILLNCWIMLGCLGILEIGKTDKKWLGWMLGVILATLYLQKIMVLGPQQLTSMALAAFALLAYGAAFVVR